MSPPLRHDGLPRLPSALAPWAEVLDLFPHEVAVLLGPLVQRLDAAVEPLRTPMEPGNGEPDGYDGLSRRGTYERLLLSDWLLAEEAPEEFVRRAAMAEHGFLRLARREPAASIETRAILDAGPSQLGTPRLVHIAALVVLARRAAAARALLLWTVAQDKGEQFNGLHASSIRSMLSARSGREPSEESLSTHFSTAVGNGDGVDLWAIGGPRLAEMARRQGYTTVTVEDVIEPGARQVAVTIRHRNRAERLLLLDLPSNQDCARILRDPFESATGAPRKSEHIPAVGSGLVWGANGTKLFARASAESILSYPVPNSPRAKAGEVRRIQNGWRMPVAAVGRWGRRTVAAGPTPGEKALWISCINGKCGDLPSRALLLPEELSPPTVTADSPLSPCLYAGGGETECLLLMDGHLLAASRLSPGAFEIMDSGVVGLGSVPGGLAYVAKRSSFWLLISLGHDGHHRTQRQFERVERVFFGWGGDFTHAHFGLVAIEQSAGEWTILGKHVGDWFSADLTPAADERVVGVVKAPSEPWPSLVVILADGKTLATRHADGLTVLLTASALIEQVAVSPVRADIAYTTKERETSVYSLTHNTHLLRLFPDGAAA